MNSVKSSAFYIFLSAFIFFLLIIRSVLVPLCHDEMATFVLYVQNGEFWPYFSNADANNHFLNSFLSHYSFHIFGFSSWALRLPNLLSFPVFVYAGYEFLKLLKSNHARWIFTGCILLSFHWIAFFALSRGYGMSMAFLFLAIIYYSKFISGGGFSVFIGMLFFLQLSVASNLTLLPITLIFSLALIIYLFLNSIFFKIKTMIPLIIHSILFSGWLNFALYLNESGAFYYGEGDNFALVTFISLVEFIFGYQNEIIIGICSLLVLFILFYSVKLNLFNKTKWCQKICDIYFILISVFFLLIIFIYLTHHLFGINYPKDRTGMFFYLLLILILSLLADRTNNEKLSKWILLFPVFFSIHFCYSFNLRQQPIHEYAVFPERFYTFLTDEQKKSDQIITVGSHHIYELTFAYFNYRNNLFLNPPDNSEKLNLYCDYLITRKNDSLEYREKYRIIDESDFDFVLLKRNSKPRKSLIRKWNIQRTAESFQRETELFYSCDSVINKSPSFMFEIYFDVPEAPSPFQSYLEIRVIDIQGKESEKRIAFHWHQWNWNSLKNIPLVFMMSNYSIGIKSIKINLINDSGEKVNFKLNELKVFAVTG